MAPIDAIGWYRFMRMGGSVPCDRPDFHSSRPGHDLRYGLDGTKMYQMGWRLPLNFEQFLEKTIHWFLSRPEWLKKVQPESQGLVHTDSKSA